MGAAHTILQEIKGVSEIWSNRKADLEKDLALHKSFIDTVVKKIASAKKFDKDVATAIQNTLGQHHPYGE